MQAVNNRGYLLEEYRLFHSKDRRDMDFESHCHDFHKIVFCLSGSVTYIMEGATYLIRPWEILIIPEHQIHRSIMNAQETYERIILWISDRFLARFDEPVLERVFRWPYERGSGLFRPSGQERGDLLERLKGVEQAQKGEFPGHALLADTYLLQFLMELSRLLDQRQLPPADSVHRDPRMSEVLKYINRNLSAELGVEELARRFFISPSYLMHEFKRHTGCTLHQYVLQKRLVQAAEAIRGGEAVGEAALSSGFSDYSVFLKAFRRMYGCAPSALKR